MLRFLFILGALMVFIYGTWTMIMPQGLNSSGDPQQADRFQGVSNKRAKMVGEAYDGDAKHIHVLTKNTDERSNAVRNEYDGPGLLALRREIARLRAEVDALRREVETLSEYDRLATTESDFYADEEKPLEILQAEELAARDESAWQLRQYIASIEERFQSEIHSPGWSIQATELIEGELQSEMFSETILVKLECRSSLCRLEVQHDNPQAASAFSNKFPETVAEMFSKFSIDHIDEGDSYSSMVIYLMQEQGD